MRIVVCVKQVPEVSELALDPATGRLRRDGVPTMINPFDRRAVLEAIRLRGEVGGSVTVVSMGPPAAADALRECLGLGADRAVHLCDPRFAGSDTLATARALARTIGSVGADLVLAGRYSLDAETGQVGPELAEMLGFPFLGGVRRLGPESDGVDATESGVALRAECESDDGVYVVALRAPGVVTCTDRWKTRLPAVLPDEERARTAPVETWSVEDLGGDPGAFGAAGSPTWVGGVQAVELGRARRVIDARESLDEGVAGAWAAIEAGRSIAGRVAGDLPARHERRADPRGAVWVIGERDPNGALRVVTFELLAAADDLAASLGVGIAVAVMDSPLGERRPAMQGMQALARELGAYGADVLLVSGSGGTLEAERFVGLLASAIEGLGPRIVLAPATSLGRDLLPAVAARLGLGLTGDAVGVELDPSGRLLQLKPAFGGQVVAPILSRTRPEMVTIRPGMLRAGRADAARPAAEPYRLADGAPAPAGVRWISYESEVDFEGAALEAARVVVCVGFGLGRDLVPDARALARDLGGTIAGTRRVCDSGWLPRQLQVGLSGRSVAPDVYLALGVRGSFNHTVGIHRAGTVVSVNRDPEAEIFAASDLGVVADAAAFLAALRARAGSA